MTNKPDIFSHVHKGIRKALFDLCLALGRVSAEGELLEARRLAAEVLHFLEHHGENEDLLLLPQLERRAPAVHARMSHGHAAIAGSLHAVEHCYRTAPAPELYQRVCALTALYLDHMREEELELGPTIYSALTADELSGFVRQAMERTSPADQRMMLAYMFAAMPQPDVQALRAKLPPGAA